MKDNQSKSIGLSVKKTKRMKRSTRDSFAGYFFMLPSLIGIIAFVVYPLSATIFYSFTSWDGLTLPKFIGWENYGYLLFSDPDFLGSIKATLYYVILVVPITLFAGLLLAMLLNKALPGIKVFRTIVYLPTILPVVATLTMFKFFFQPENGLANQILLLLHLPECKWLTSAATVMPTLLLIAIWGVGSMMIIFLAGLQSIPAEIYEAADIDGATGIRRFVKITIPMVSPIISLQLITGIIAGFQIMNPALLITSDGRTPGGPNGATNFINYAIYLKAFVNHDYGAAMAQVMFLLVIISVFSIPVFKLTNAYTYYEAENG